MVYVVIIPVTLTIILLIQSQHYATNVPYNLSDANWQYGVSKSQSAFFVSLNSQNLKELKVGVKIRFRSGVRTITGAFVAAPYLNIQLEGLRLEPEKDGYPNTYEILK